jgi:hypothetical protein
LEPQLIFGMNPKHAIEILSNLRIGFCSKWQGYIKEQASDPYQWKYFQHGRLGQATLCLV